MKQAIGYSLFVLSFITWGAIAVVPFLDVSIGMATAYTTGLVIIGAPQKLDKLKGVT